MDLLGVMFLWLNDSEIEYSLVANKNSLCRGKVFFTEIKWLRTSKAWPKYQDPRLGLWCSKKYKVRSWPQKS